MATGRSIMLTKQIGEYLVASELARRGLIVATFSGNVPDFDIIATDLKGSSCPIQVKTIQGGSWQFSIDKFAEIIFEGEKQKIGDRTPQNIPNLLCVFVISDKKYGADQFFILEWSKVQDIVIANYQRWLDLHGGIRPKKFDSLHCAVIESDLLIYKDNWPIITNRLER
jgi:hypothetical protein